MDAITIFLSAGIYKKVWAAEARAMGSMEEF
jgi:hypothetical protein